MCVDRYSFRIFSNEDSIMVIRIFIDKSILDKAIDDLSVYHSLVHQITVHPSHIRMFPRQFEWFLYFGFLWLFRTDYIRIDPVAKQTSDGIGIG